MEISLLITIAMVVVILAVAAGLWAAHRSARPVLVGLGLALVAVGAYLTHVTRLAINGVRSLIDWAQRTVWTDQMSWGAGLLAAGVVLLVIGSLLRSAPTRRQPAEPAARPGVKPATRPGVPAPAATKQPAAPASKQADAEDAEIEALLRKRGIM